MTREQLESARTMVPQLFAYGIDAACNKIGSSSSGLTYKAGIPPSYSSLRGKKVNYADINGLFRATTQSKWFNQLGGYYTFDDAVSEAIGGYPEGAVLSYRDPVTGYVREVRSLIPDNQYNFVENPEYINNEFWAYVDNVPPSDFRPRIFPKYKDKTEGVLRVDETLEIKVPCMVMIATGCDGMDSTGDGQDFYLYATVKQPDGDLFYTAGLVCFLPNISDVLSEGVLVDYRDCENANSIAQKTQKCFSAVNSPSPIQLYLLPGDILKLTGNRDFQPIYEQTYHYWMFPLSS